MTLAQILASFINEAGYDEEIIHNEATGHVELTTGLALENQSCTLCFRGDENLHRLSLTIVLPFRVNPGKESEACMLFNFINDHYMYPGRVTADADRKIRYKEIIDTDSTKPSLDIINTMLNNGTGLLKYFFGEIAAVSLTPPSSYSEKFFPPQTAFVPHQCIYCTNEAKENPTNPQQQKGDSHAPCKAYRRIHRRPGMGQRHR